MRRNIVIAALCGVSAAGLFISQQNQAQPPIEPPVQTPEDLKDMDTKFLQGANQCNLMEIAMARLVASKTDKPEVKDFAQMMITDHTTLNNRIREIAQKKSVMLSGQLEPWQQALLDHVNTVSPKEIGCKYMFHQVGGHETSVLFNRYAALHAQDPEIRSFADRTVPQLRSHLQRAERISEDIVARGDQRITRAERQP